MARRCLAASLTREFEHRSNASFHQTGAAGKDLADSRFWLSKTNWFVRGANNTSAECLFAGTLQRLTHNRLPMAFSNPNTDRILMEARGRCDCCITCGTSIAVIPSHVRDNPAATGMPGCVLRPHSRFPPYMIGTGRSEANYIPSRTLLQGENKSSEEKVWPIPIVLLG